mmetsp:Transcript_24643/g.30291  ORF Transcript_24643/g.30291 Transcript_24643/m.30291 type:complete len:84 (+) Transcript_24643:50-301(+)
MLLFGPKDSLFKLLLIKTLLSIENKIQTNGFLVQNLILNLFCSNNKTLPSQAICKVRTLECDNKNTAKLFVIALKEESFPISF